MTTAAVDPLHGSHRLGGGGCGHALLRPNTQTDGGDLIYAQLLQQTLLGESRKFTIRHEYVGLYACVSGGVGVA